MTMLKVRKISASAPAEGAPKTPTIILFGDSHSHAVQRAIEKREGKGQSVPLRAHRLLKPKNGKQLGDTTFEDFIEIARKLEEQDVVLSMIGGNQHSVYSMIQHPQPFDFYTPDTPEIEATREVVPYRALEDAFTNGLRTGDGKSLEALRNATTARVVHIIPPPPKADTAFIEQNHETRFAQEGLSTHGVSPPALRLKFWKLQAKVLKQICANLGIELMMPPASTVDAQGFLLPEYYAQDATHANWRYGERLIRQVERQYLGSKHAVARGAA